MLNKDLIQRKIALIQDELLRLTEFENLTIEEASKDYKSQAIVERLLERVIGRALDINQHIIAEMGVRLESIKKYRETFIKLSDLGVYPIEFAEKIAPCAGFRNALIHEYNNLDKEIVRKSIKLAIQEFNDYSKYILAFIEKKD